MPTMLSRRAAVLVKIEGSEGVDAVPTAVADAVLVEQPLRITFSPNIIDTTEVNPSLDPFDPIVGGMSATIEFDLYLKGSGAAGTAPEWDEMIRCCGFAAVTQGTAIPVAAEACAAGGSTTTGVLGTTAGTVAQAYRGMPVILSGANTLTTMIYNYTAAKMASFTDTALTPIIATTQYQIQPCVVYSPASNSISSATIWVYIDGVLYKFVGCRGTCPLTLTSGGPARISFRFMGMFTTKTDVVLPTTTTYDATRPPIWKGGSFTINSAPAAGQTLSIDPGNNLVLPDNPNSAEAFDPAIITARQVRGSINPKEVLVATRDVMAAFRAQTKQPLQARLGTVAGNRIGITVPSALYLNQTPGDNNGYQITDVPFHATGLDSGYTIAVF